jgi:hypothetical protein
VNAALFPRTVNFRLADDPVNFPKRDFLTASIHSEQDLDLHAENGSRAAVPRERQGPCDDLRVRRATEGPDAACSCAGRIIVRIGIRRICTKLA